MGGNFSWASGNLKCQAVVDHGYIRDFVTVAFVTAWVTYVITPVQALVTTAVIIWYSNLTLE